jgi:hypothetical protein
MVRSPVLKMSVLNLILKHPAEVALQVHIMEDQQAAKRREHDRKEKLKNMEFMQHITLLRRDLQQQVCPQFLGLLTFLKRFSVETKAPDYDAGARAQRGDQSI